MFRVVIINNLVTNTVAIPGQLRGTALLIKEMSGESLSAISTTHCVI
jgi:hypothetical protein